MACLLMGSCGDRSRAIAREMSKDLQSSLPPSPSCVAASRFVSRSSRLPSCRLLRSRVFAWTGPPSPSSLSLLSSSLACGEAASGGAPVVLEELDACPGVGAGICIAPGTPGCAPLSSSSSLCGGSCKGSSSGASSSSVCRRRSSGSPAAGTAGSRIEPPARRLPSLLHTSGALHSPSMFVCDLCVAGRLARQPGQL